MWSFIPLKKIDAHCHSFRGAEVSSPYKIYAIGRFELKKNAMNF